MLQEQATSTDCRFRKFPGSIYPLLDGERMAAANEFSQTEGLNTEKLEIIIGEYSNTDNEPLRYGIISLMDTKPYLMDRKTIAERKKDKPFNLWRPLSAEFLQRIKRGNLQGEA